MLTSKERKRLAKEARKLAMECVEGTAPKFGTGREFKDGKPCCAMGHVTARAGLGPVDESSGPLSWCISQHDWCVAAFANDDRPTELPWALLSLADALEAKC